MERHPFGAGREVWQEVGLILNYGSEGGSRMGGGIVGGVVASRLSFRFMRESSTINPSAMAINTKGAMFASPAATCKLGLMVLLTLLGCSHRF